MSTALLVWLAECVIVAYLDDCEDRGLRPRTVEWYEWHLRRMVSWLVNAPGWHAADLVRVEGMSAYYASSRTLARTTRRHMVAAFRAFGGWLESHGVGNPAMELRKPKAVKCLPRALSGDELGRLLVALESEPLRERAFVYVAVDSGLRVSEMVGLRRRDVEVETGVVRVRDGKGGRDRVVFVGVTTGRVLDEYLQSHDEDRVFVGCRPGRGADRLTRSGAGQIMRRLAARHGFERLNPHLLRHTAATELVAAGVDLGTLADQLGHSDVATTRIYAAMADERRREVVRRASPIDRQVSRCAIAVPGWPQREQSD